MIQPKLWKFEISSGTMASTTSYPSLRLATLASIALVGALGSGAGAVGCAGVHSGATAGTGGAGAFGSTGGASSTLGRRTRCVAGTGGTRSVVLSDGGQIVGCDGGDACMCPPFKVAVIGKPGKWGANPTGDPDTALQDWLNSSSAGSAQADNFTSAAHADRRLLGHVQRDHPGFARPKTRTADRGGRFPRTKWPAFRAWVENGGGVITLAGYSGNPGEISPLNQLIGFSGVTYSTDGTWGTCADGQTCNCTHSNTLSEWNRTDPVVAKLRPA